MKIKTFPLPGHGKKFIFRKGRYQADGSDAYFLNCFDEGYEEEYTTLSVCLDFPPKEGVWIKNYSENEELVAALEKGGYLERTGQVCHCGYATVPSMTLTAKGREYLQEGEYE